MEIIDILPQLAILLIYPDGEVEYSSTDYRVYHMEHFIDLAISNSRLNMLTNTKNIPIPREFDFRNSPITYDVDTALAQNGVAIFHNLYSDDGLAFNVTLPSNLTPEQRDLIKRILNQYDLSESSYASLTNDLFDTITYSDFCDMIHNQEKS